MAWSISIADEGWIKIREALKVMSFESLCEAVGDHNDFCEGERDILEDQAFDCIHKVDTCDNGGFNYWIDQEGYNKVYIEDGGFTYNASEDRIEIKLNIHSGVPTSNEDRSLYEFMFTLVDTEFIEDDIVCFYFPVTKSDCMLKNLNDKGFFYHSADLTHLLDYRMED